jgi:hypothetical protein
MPFGVVVIVKLWSGSSTPSLLIPKSTIFSVPSCCAHCPLDGGLPRENSTFFGRMSEWTTPRACRKLAPASSSRTTRMRSATPRSPSAMRGSPPEPALAATALLGRSITSYREHTHSSIPMKTRSGSSSTHRYLMMLSLPAPPAAVSRCSSCFSFEIPFAFMRAFSITLTATLPQSACSPRWTTVPMLPSPRTRSENTSSLPIVFQGPPLVFHSCVVGRATAVRAPVGNRGADLAFGRSASGITGGLLFFLPPWRACPQGRFKASASSSCSALSCVCNDACGPEHE